MMSFLQSMMSHNDPPKHDLSCDFLGAASVISFCGCPYAMPGGSGSLWRHGAFWCPLVPFGALWCPLVPFGAFWCLLVPFGALWCLLVPFGAFWCLLVPSGAFWCPLVPFAAFWCPLVPFGAFWCLLVSGLLEELQQPLSICVLPSSHADT